MRTHSGGMVAVSTMRHTASPSRTLRLFASPSPTHRLTHSGGMVAVSTMRHAASPSPSRTPRLFASTSPTHRLLPSPSLTPRHLGSPSRNPRHLGSPSRTPRLLASPSPIPRFGPSPSPLLPHLLGLPAPVLAGAQTDDLLEGEPVQPPIPTARPPWWRLVCALSTETTKHRSLHVIVLLVLSALKNSSFLPFVEEKATRFKVPPKLTAGLLLGAAAITFLFDVVVMGKDLNEVCAYLMTYRQGIEEEDSAKAQIQDSQVGITNVEE